jgi:hypothetical protein
MMASAGAIFLMPSTVQGAGAAWGETALITTATASRDAHLICFPFQIEAIIVL